MHLSSYNLGTVLMQVKIWPRIPKEILTEQVNLGQIFTLHEVRCSPSPNIHHHCPRQRLPQVQRLSPYCRNQNCVCVVKFHCCFLAVSYVMIPWRQGPCPPELICSPPRPLQPLSRGRGVLIPTRLVPPNIPTQETVLIIRVALSGNWRDRTRNPNRPPGSKWWGGDAQVLIPEQGASVWFSPSGHRQSPDLWYSTSSARILSLF